MSEQSAITIKSITKRFGKLTAVKDFSLTVPEGCCYGLFGPNGAGKTTAIRCLLGLLRPEAGKLSIYGHDPVREEVKARSRLAYVPENVAFYPWMTVKGTLRYTSSFYEKWNLALQEDLIKRFDFDEKQKKDMSKWFLIACFVLIFLELLLIKIRGDV